MVTKKDLMHFCRYYKGTTQCPFTEQNEKMFWEYEKVWVEKSWESSMNGKLDSVLSLSLDQYIANGLSTFSDMDGVPVGIKALLFNRYEHWLEGSPNDFKKWYLNYYLKKAG